MSPLRSTAAASMGLALAVGLTLTACEQPISPGSSPEADATASHTPASMHAMSQTFRAELEPIGNSGVHGTANFQLEGDQLSVQLVARGLESGTHAQHIHMNATCANFGGVQIPLDFDLGDGDGPADGPFPETSGMSGTLTYSQMASASMFSNLPLGEKTVVVHATDFAPVACGEINPVGHGP